MWPPQDLTELEGVHLALESPYSQKAANDLGTLQPYYAPLKADPKETKLDPPTLAEGDDRQDDTVSAEPENEEVPQAEDSEKEVTTVERGVFRKSGQFWKLAFRDGKLFHLKLYSGLDYIHCLLRYPNKELKLMELVALVEKYDSGAEQLDSEEQDVLQPTDLGDHYKVLDEEAKKSYRERLEELEEELETATMVGDDNRALRAQEEKDQLIKWLKNATGLGGRSRRFTDPVEKARTRLYHNTTLALDKINELDSALYEHLSSSITRGYYCSYRPDPDTPIDWEL